MRPVIGATMLGGGIVILMCSRTAAKATIPPGTKVRGSRGGASASMKDPTAPYKQYETLYSNLQKA